MNVCCRRFTLLVLSACLAFVVHAQESPETQPLPEAAYHKPIRFETLGWEDGLTQNTVFDILQDRQGFLWFGVSGALNRYDGYEIKAYKNVPYDATSMVPGDVWSLHEDRDGDLWVGSNRGLARFDQETETFTHFTPSERGVTAWLGGIVFDIDEDQNGTLWVATGNQGLRRMDDERTGRFTGFTHDPDDPQSLSHNRAFSIHEDKAGRFWVGTFNGLNRMDPDEPGRFTRYLVVEDDATASNRAAIFRFHDDPVRPDVLWLGTGNGLLEFDANTGAVTRHLEDTVDGRPVAISGITQDPDAPHIFWVSTGFAYFGTGNGLVRFDTRTGQHTRYRHTPGDPLGLPENNLFSIYTDRSGIVWTGVQEAGLARLDPSPDGFLHYRHVPGDPNSLPDGGVWDFAEDYEGGLWATVDFGDIRSGGRLVRIDRRSGTVTRFEHDPSDPSSISPGIVNGILVDSQGRVWTWYGGEGWLNRMDPKTGRAIRYQPDPSDPRPVFWIEEDRDGRLWVYRRQSTRPSSDLLQFDPATETFTPFLHDPDDPTTLSSDQVTGLRIGSSGTVWVGTTNGLNRFDPATETFTRYARAPNDTTAGVNAMTYLYEGVDGHVWGIADDGEHVALVRFDPATETWTTYRHDPDDPTSFYITRPVPFPNLHEREREPGVLWISTYDGLMRMDTRTGTFQYFTERDGFTDAFLYALVEDDAGRLWMSSNGGLHVLEPGPGDTAGRLFIRNYDFSDGLQANEFNGNAFSKSPRTGELFFGGINGITAFFPDQVLDNPVPPTVTLTDFRLFNESVQPGPDAPLAKSVAHAEEIRLAHDQKSIAFDYVGLHFQNPKKNQYRYQLEGFDEDWVEAGAQRTVSYTNLDPGDYTFRVMAANSDGVWNEEAASIRVVVAPPWWRTTWAYLLYGLLFVGGIFAVDRFQRHRLLRKERERAAIAEAELRAEAAEANARALEADNQRKQHVELLSEIGKEITASLDIDTIFDNLYAHAGQLMDADSFGVGLYHAERQQIEYRLAIEQGKRYTPYTRDATDKNQFPVWCIAHRAPVFINDVAQEYSRYIDRFDDTRQELEDGSLSDAPQSLIYLPLMAQERVLGVITVQSFEKDAYTEHDLNVLKTLAAYTSIALDNAAAYRQLGTTLTELKATQAQLVQQEKLASLGQVTAGVAHEIKNPLNFVNNFAELNEELAQELAEELIAHKDKRIADVLDDLGELVGSLKTNARQIHKHGKRADAIVKNMMEHARASSGERYRIEVNPFVEEYVGVSYHGMQVQMQDLAVTIERDFDEAAGNVEMAPQEMGRVLLNLLNNAFEAVHEKADAETRGRGDAETGYAPTVTVSTRRNGEAVEIRIADNGPGIDAALREKIFEPFFTTKPTGSGTGLGLSMSYDIVVQGHSGTLAVESEEGEGATFVITLPTDSRT